MEYSGWEDLYGRVSQLGSQMSYSKVFKWTAR